LADQATMPGEAAAPDAKDARADATASSDAQASQDAHSSQDAQAGADGQAGPDAQAGPDGQAGPDAHGSPDAQGGPDAEAGPDSPVGPDAQGPTDAHADADGTADAQDAGGYDPCPGTGPCKVMPLGDSITYGVGSTTGGGYRIEIFHQALQHSQHVTFVGSQTSGPPTVDGVTFPQENEGHSGYTIDNGGGRSGISPLVVSAMNTYKPNIITLMIGTNDVNIQLDLANAPTRLANLVDLILSTDPNVLLVLAQIVPTQDDGTNANVMTYNAAMPQIVSTRAAAGKHIVLVDMYSAFVADANFKTDYMSDSLHPNDAGHAVMGDVWYGVLGPLLH
jgi:lysophospholipase L1-like esterase